MSNQFEGEAPAVATEPRDATSELRETTWNPTTGCDRISPGCDNCYALVLSGHLKTLGHPDYQRDGSRRTSGPGFGMTLHEHSLSLPRYWAEPRRVLVNSMSDLFHRDVPLSFLRQVFKVMEATPQHSYQVLTKRSHRLRQLVPQLTWPENVCMGVSVESDEYVFRVDHLRDVPATKRFVHLEPLLGAVPSLDLTGIDWIVVGAENGPDARPMDEAWVTEVERHCRKTGTALALAPAGRTAVDAAPGVGWERKSTRRTFDPPAPACE